MYRMEDSLHVAILGSWIVDIAGCDERHPSLPREPFVSRVDEAGLLKFPEGLDFEKVIGPKYPVKTVDDASRVIPTISVSGSRSGYALAADERASEQRSSTSRKNDKTCRIISEILSRHRWMIMVISPRLRDKSVEIPVSIIVLREDRKVILPLATVLIDWPAITFQSKDWFNTFSQRRLLKLEE